MTPEVLTQIMGSHPSGPLGLRSSGSDVSGSSSSPRFSEQGLDRWLVACCLLAHPVDPAQACESVRRLAERGWALPSTIAKLDPSEVASVLSSTDHPKPEPTAHLLVRVCRGLEARHGGSLATLYRDSDDLEELARRLMGLASGFGRAAVARLLRPLRDTWPLADEIPLDPAARAAARHLGWIGEGQDEDGAPGALRAFLRRHPPDPPGATQFCDVEAALERLGRKACLRERSDRCPLQDRCPAREQG